MTNLFLFPHRILFKHSRSLQFLKLVALCHFLIYSPVLLSQNNNMEKKRIAANKLKTMTCFRCEYVFGKPDSCERLSVTNYDKTGNVVEVISSPDKEYAVKNHYTYDKSGNLLKTAQVVGKDTTTWKNEYDPYGRKIKQVTYKNRLKTAEYKYQYQNGNVISTAGYTAQGKLIYLSENKYNPNGKLIENLFFNGTDTTLTRHIYNKDNKQDAPTNKPVHEVYYDQDTIVLKRTINKDRSVHEEKFQYDHEKRLVQIVYHDSGRYDNIQIVDFQYDQKGNKTGEITTDKNSPSKTSGINYEYDSAGNLLRSLSTRSSIGKISKSYSYNNKEQLVRVVDHSPGSDSTTYQYSYDEAGNKTQEIKTHRNMVFTNDYGYDANRKLTKEQHYLALQGNQNKTLIQTVTYEYNHSNAVSRATYQDFHMDLFYQKQKLQDSTGKFPGKGASQAPLIYSVAYKYDDRNNLIGKYEDKALNKSNGYNANAHKYEYNDANKLTEHRTYYDNSERIGRKSVFEYDDKGNLSVEKTILGGAQDRISQIVQYRYNSENQQTDEFVFSFNGKQISHKKYIYNAKGKTVEERVFEPDEHLIRYSYEQY